MHDSIDLVSNWCDNNHMAISPMKTKPITITKRQKYQLKLQTGKRCAECDTSSISFYSGRKLIKCWNTVL